MSARAAKVAAAVNFMLDIQRSGRVMGGFANVVV